MRFFMEQRISNKHAGILQSIILCLGAIFLMIFGFTLLQGPLEGEQGFAAAVVSLISLSSCYYFAGFYNVSFDDDFIYITRLRTTAKVALENIENVKPDIFPIRFFLRNVYIVNVSYLVNGRKRKLRFFSTGARGTVGTVDNIPFLDSLRQKIKEKKSPSSY
jgi:hypothetical protein